MIHPYNRKDKSPNRVTCIFSPEVIAEVAQIVEEDCVYIHAVVEKLVRHGLLLRTLLKDPNVKVIVRDENGEREITVP